MCRFSAHIKNERVNILMRDIILYAHMMTNEIEASEYLDNQFEFRILTNQKMDIDDFLDSLLEINEETIIKLDDTMTIVDNLGRFGLGIIKSLHIAEEMNECISLELL